MEPAEAEGSSPSVALRRVTPPYAHPQERRKSGLPELLCCAIFVVRRTKREILETNRG
jgi:hypothetical protein